MIHKRFRELSLPLRFVRELIIIHYQWVYILPFLCRKLLLHWKSEREAAKQNYFSIRGRRVAKELHIANNLPRPFISSLKKFHLTNNSHKKQCVCWNIMNFSSTQNEKKKTKTYNIIIIFCIHFVRSSQFFFMLRLCCCIQSFDSFYFISCTRHWSEWMDQWFRGRIIKWMKPAAQNGELRNDGKKEKKLQWKCNFKFA